jgi:DNA-binding response OmpR family regulator
MPRILVVDDERDVRAMMSIVLRVKHFDVTEAASIAAALTAFEQSSFDAAIVDIFLAGANGFDLIAAMRERVPNLPVVAVSGMTTLELASAPLDMASVVCLQKPFRPNDLIAAIATARGERRGSDGGHAAAGTTAV